MDSVSGGWRRTSGPARDASGQPHGVANGSIPAGVATGEALRQQGASTVSPRCLSGGAEW